MLQKEDFICIGTLGRSHGVKGEISAKLDIDIEELFQMHKDFFLLLEENELLIPYRVLSFRPKHGSALLHLSNIVTKEEADKLTNSPVWIDKELLSEVEEISFNSFAQLEGFVLYNDKGQLIGKIIEVDESTINTILYVQSAKGEEYILPFAEELITELNIEEHKLCIKVAEGLLDLEHIEEI